MQMMRGMLIGFIALLCAGAVDGWAAPPQTQPWRIAVGGGYCTGYWGMLGRYGLPRERLREECMGDPEYLKQFDVVMIAHPSAGAAPTARAVSEYVQQGGIAVTGLYVVPPEAVLPGARINTQRGPNVQFVPSPSPVSEGLPAIGILPSHRRPANSIIPDPARPDTFIMARFTDEGAHDDVKGIFRDGKQGAPAIILFKHGEGWWLWSGTWMEFWTTLSGPHFEPLILNTLRHLSEGELTSRWSLAKLEPERLLTTPREPDTRTRKRTGRGDAAPPPEDFEVWDEDLERAGDFDLVATLPPGASAEVLTAYWNQEWQRAVRFEPGKVVLVRVEGDRETQVAAAPLNGSAKQPRRVHITRRRAEVFVRVDGTPLLGALEGLEQKGVVASRGLEEVMCQPAAPPEFRDDFMRLPEDQDEWETISGEWSVQQEKGDRDAGVASMSANPFRYEAKSPAEGEGRAITGAWSWDDYHFEASVRAGCDAVALLGHYQDDANHLALRVPVAKAPGEEGEARLVAVEDGAERLIASAPGHALFDQWHKLALRLSGGYVQGLLDGKVVVQGLDTARGTGMVGLALSGGGALFDDVVVTPWVAMPRPYGPPSAADWQVEQGICEASAGNGEALHVRGQPNARVISSWAGQNAYDCWASIRLGRAAEAGLYMRYLSPREHYLVTLEPDANSLVRIALRREARDATATLGEALLEGGVNVARTVLARLADEHIQVWVDGEKLFDVMDEGPRWGRIGLHVRGDHSAAFRGVGALPVAREHHLVDELTPGFAGIVDRHTWAGKANFLFADPADLTRWWHRGEFPGDVTAKVAVRQQMGEPAAVASLYLGDGADPSSGYELRATRTWDEAPVKIEAFRRGERVGAGTVDLPVTRAGFVAELARTRGALILRLDGEAALSFADPEPLDVRRVGMKLAGTLIHPDDTRIETPEVRAYTFGEAATDWLTEAGTWDVASRWSCSPGWTWFGGWDRKDAWTTNKHVFEGDQRMDMFVGAKMVDIEGEQRKQEVLRDIRMALCATPGDLSSGYRFTLGGRNNTWTAIERNGEVVAEMQWAVPQGGLHNDWTLVSAVKRGSVVVLEWEGHEILRYEDPEPIAGGHVAMGTFDNGLMIPKVTIHGKARQPATPALALARALAPVPVRP